MYFSRFPSTPYLEAYLRDGRITGPGETARDMITRIVAARLQRDARVIVSPGYQFGPSGVGHFRVCYARDENEWERALIAMVDALRDLGREQGTS